MYINILILLIASGSVVYDYTPGEMAVAGFQKYQLVESHPMAGRVIEQGSGIPVQHVIIRWKGTSESIITDAKGEFRIENQIRSKKLLISKPGWIEKSIRHRRIKKMKFELDGRGEKIILIKLRKSKRTSFPVQPEEDLPPGNLPAKDLSDGKLPPKSSFGLS